MEEEIWMMVEEIRWIRNKVDYRGKKGKRSKDGRSNGRGKRKTDEE